MDLLFEFILGDKKILLPMRGLLARLQIPMLKISIADKGFFQHLHADYSTILLKRLLAGYKPSITNKIHFTNTSIILSLTSSTTSTLTFAYSTK